MVIFLLVYIFTLGLQCRNAAWSVLLLKARHYYIHTSQIKHSEHDMWVLVRVRVYTVQYMMAEPVKLNSLLQCTGAAARWQSCVALRIHVLISSLLKADFPEAKGMQWTVCLFCYLPTLVLQQYMTKLEFMYMWICCTCVMCLISASLKCSCVPMHKTILVYITFRRSCCITK